MLIQDSNFRTLDLNQISSNMINGNTQTQQSPNGFDPYASLLKSKQSPLTVQYSDEDIKELEDFCTSHNIIGFNPGKMSPKSALQMLKSRMGIKTETTLPSKKTLLYG
jgi:hypothetical protein